MSKADIFLRSDIKRILAYGTKDENPRPKYKDGTPAYTYSLNHMSRSYDLTKEFPFCTLRPQAWRSAIKEILWIYQDASNSLDVLRKKYNIHYWDEWESKEIPNTIGKRYGHTVKRYGLMKQLLFNLQHDPFSRRHIMDLWQEDELNSTDGLYPCAFMTTWNVRKDYDGLYLDMVLFQRSGDMLTASGAGGINEIQYATLLLMVAKHCGYKAGKFTHFIANEQIYDRHIENANIILIRESVLYNPHIIINNDEKTNFYDFTIDDFSLIEDNGDVIKLDDIKKINPQLTFELGI